MVEMKPSAVSRPLSALLLLFAGPLAGQTSLSIYSDGRVVVRRSLPQALEKGRNALTLKLEDLDPATLFSPDTSDRPTVHGSGRRLAARRWTNAGVRAAAVGRQE